MRGIFNRPKERVEPTAPLNAPEANSPFVNPLPQAPPTYTYALRREPAEGPSFLTAPDSQYSAMQDLGIAWQEAPDPIRQSDFWADGQKIHPQAQMMVNSHLAIGYQESISEQTFRIGKLLGYFPRPMYAGQQKPSIPRSNIQEAQPTTYGSQYQIQEGMPSGPVLASGMLIGGNDGYPY